ncbi:MAG: radical SAM protein [Deltaproteobacteria bacterium]|nr:radical SAM protein [Deltaproteobacteria bacterium]
MRIYGPVPSRRFGLSLGVDLVPHKTCSFDCIYCQLGPTDHLTGELQDFFEVDEILADVKEVLEDGPRPDVITFAGSGEPTLYRSLGDLVDRLRRVADIPILLITNSTQLWREEVAKAVQKVDILAPSLDAGDEATYRHINRSHPDIPLDKLLRGLVDVTHSFEGEIRLEVMLIRDINDDEKNLKSIARLLDDLRFDQVDVNTPVRPPVPERGALPCYQDTLDRALELFGPKAKAIGAFTKRVQKTEGQARSFSDLDKDIREMLLRRPCTLDDIASSLGLERLEVERSLERLTSAGLVDSHPDQGYYYVPASPRHR